MPNQKKKSATCDPSTSTSTSTDPQITSERLHAIAVETRKAVSASAVPYIMAVRVALANGDADTRKAVLESLGAKPARIIANLSTMESADRSISCHLDDPATGERIGPFYGERLASAILRGDARILRSLR